MSFKYSDSHCFLQVKIFVQPLHFRVLEDTVAVVVVPGSNDVSGELLPIAKGQVNIDTQ